MQVAVVVVAVMPLIHQEVLEEGVLVLMVLAVSLLLKLLVLMALPI